MKQNLNINKLCRILLLAGIIIASNSSSVSAQDNNSIIPLDRNSVLPTLKFSGTDQYFSQTFLFQCTDSTSLNVASVILEDPESPFTVKAMPCCSGLPMVAMPGDIVGVRITLQANAPNTYHNRLKFILGDGAAPIIYNIEAIKSSPLAGVNSTNQELFNISTAPNPSTGNVSMQVKGVDRADIEIFDALGKLVASKNNAASWNWNGISAEGITVPAGNYFVRAAAQNANGKIIINTKHILIIR